MPNIYVYTHIMYMYITAVYILYMTFYVICTNKAIVELVTQLHNISTTMYVKNIVHVTYMFMYMYVTCTCNIHVHVTLSIHVHVTLSILLLVSCSSNNC